MYCLTYIYSLNLDLSLYIYTLTHTHYNACVGYVLECFPIMHVMAVMADS